LRSDHSWLAREDSAHVTQQEMAEVLGPALDFRFASGVTVYTTVYTKPFQP
jgi:hypothetical protein